MSKAKIHKHKIDKECDSKVHKDFGGPIGVTFIMAFFPCLMYYLWASLQFNDGKLLMPESVVQIPQFLKESTLIIYQNAYPSWQAIKIYCGFSILQLILAFALPGPIVKGMPVPSLNFQSLEYLCNGVSAWYVTLTASFVSLYFGWFDFAKIIDNFGSLLTVSMIVGFSVTILTYLYGILSGDTHRMSGNFIYDLFMGAVLNPRIGRLDLKIWAEIRIPWLLLFYISFSAAVKEYQTLGYIRPEVAFMVLAHFLYANACMKGEECIPTTWDIFYEKWGFMLIFWNFSGVPFTYSYATIYLVISKSGRAIHHSTAFLVFEYTLLLVGYYIWDTANSQKNRFRMSQIGTFIPRKTFPQLPWGTLVNPNYIKTEHGNYLLISGWWGIARKIHYTADLMMAFSWAFMCGLDSVIPFFYPVFFVFVLVHRVGRDMERCKAKYGKDWEKYCDHVPYIFIPYIY